MLQRVSVATAGAVVAAVAASHAAASPVAAAAAEAEVCPGCEVDAEEVVALQLRSQRNHIASATSKRKAAAFEGGGWRAFATQAAFVGGLLAVIEEEEIKSEGATSPLDALFRAIDTVSSNSGGSWFAASLLYSNETADMLERIGRAPSETGKIYRRDYTDKLLNISAFFEEELDGEHRIDNAQESCDDKLDELMEKLRKKHEKDKFEAGVPWDELMGQVLGLAGMGTMSWPAFVSRMLWSTAGLDTGSLMGGPGNKFAEGKLFMLCAAVPTPGGKLDWAEYPDSSFYVNRLGFKETFSARATSPTAEFPPFLPTKHSITIGAGEDAESPLPFCAEENCFDIRFDYELTHGMGLRKPKDWKKEGPALGQSVHQAFETAGGRIPIHQAVSGSSAFLGGLVLNPLMGFMYGECLDFTTWSTSAPEGESFKLAQTTIIPNVTRAHESESDFEFVADNNLAPVIDGAFTDNTGVAQAVAAGATEVVVFACYDDLSGLFKESHTWPDQKPNLLWATIASFQIFAESPDDVMKQFKGEDSATGKGFTSLEIVEKAEHLKGIHLGTVTGTTVDCPWFGISAGMTVTMHVLYADMSIGMGASNSWRDYDVAVHEVVTSMVDKRNRELVKPMLEKVMA